jgi:cell division protease FtsH
LPDPLKTDPRKKPFAERLGLWRTFLVWAAIFICIALFWKLFAQKEGFVAEIPFSRFQQEVTATNVKSVSIVEKQISGELKQEIPVNVKGKDLKAIKFKTYIPFEDPELVRELVQGGIELKSQPASNAWTMLLPWLLPLVLVVAFYFIIFRQMQSGPNRAFTFGKSSAKLMDKKKVMVTFDDVAGVEEAKQELSEVVEFLKAPKKFQRLGGKIPKGVLLLGPPGTGKTLLARAVAGEAGVPFFSISGSDFVEMFVGVGASRVRDLFDQGKRNAPCIIFIDELDAVGRLRGAGLGGGHDEREQTLNALLVEMDGFDPNEGVILLAATNRPDVLDPALLRAGRFDRRVVVDRPDVKGREGILKVHTRKIPIAVDVDLEVLARGTPGFSGADLANMVNEAALLAAKHSREKVTMQDMEYAKDKILMGVERKSLLISETEKKNIAFHEAGHVLVSKLTPGSDPIHKATIIPRGMALGQTQKLPIDDRRTYSKSYCMAQMVSLLGGRAAEIVALEDVTTGAADDIDKATELARMMVCDWGMSESLGPLTFGKKEEEVFLGREIATHRDYSEETAVMIDKEVRKIVETAQSRALGIVKGNGHLLKALADALLEKEILNADDVARIIDEANKGRIGEQAESKTGSKAAP